VLALSFALGAGSADAHSKNEATQPANGAVLEAPPSTIAVRFDMPMRVTLISLTDQDGATHDLKRTDNMQPVSEFSAEPPPLPVGQYKVEWRGWRPMVTRCRACSALKSRIETLWLAFSLQPMRSLGCPFA
jgi:methionine-rich copper-binding protein CopC